MKSIFIWNLFESNDSIYNRLVSGNFSAVQLHHTNVFTWKSDARVTLARYLKDRGIKVYGSSAVYGVDATSEGMIAGQLVNELGLDGFVFDAESAFDSKENPDSNAVKLLNTYKSLTLKPSFWCWWPFYKSPTTGSMWHPLKVLVAAMTVADYGMPMVYWNWGNDVTNAVNYTTEALNQWRAVTNKPLIPIGRAYSGDGGYPYSDAMLAFENKVLTQAGISWWSLQHIVPLTDQWNTLKAMVGFTTPVELVNQYKALTNTNVRTSPTTTATKTDVLLAGTTIEVLEMTENEGYMWARHSKGWSAMHTIGTQYLKKV